MSNMECPFCQQKLECCAAYLYGTRKLGCANCGVTGDSKLFDEIIRTRKALDKAKSVLTNLNDYARLDGLQEWDVEEALAEIKASEQEELK